MKFNNIVKLIFLLIAFSIVALVTSKLTYNSVAGKAQSEMQIKKNIFAEERDSNQIYFNFKENINTIIYSIKNGKNKDKCNLKKINNIIPINIKHRSDVGVSVIEIFNKNIENNQRCFDFIIKYFDEKYKIRLNEMIESINNEHNIIKKIEKNVFISSMQLKQRESEKYKENLEKKMNIKLIKKNEISFSDFIDLLINNNIVETFIGGGYVSGSLTDGTQFYTIFKGLFNYDFLIRKLYESQISINIIDIDFEKKIVNLPNFPRSEREYNIKIEILKKKLSLSPYVLLSIEHKYQKMKYYNYLLILLIAFNLLALIIYLIVNKKFLDMSKNLLNKITN